jgi:DHA1 family bicyclomycin/chloramphenicol resistance-like MFS transporter
MLQRTTEGSLAAGQPTSASPAFGEFVALIALMMGITAFSVDNLLPAFQAIRTELGVADPNRPQLLIYVYMIAFALSQTVYGPLSDMFGRRRVLMGGLAVYLAGCVLAMFAPTFPLLLASRAVQGMGSAAARVLSTTIVRDRFAGREMARVMSLAMMTFLIVPIFAPAIGSGLLLIAGWRWIFGAMTLLALTLALWFMLRMPETLHPEYRLPLSFSRLGAALKLTVTTRVTVGYSAAVGLMVGCVMSYVGSAPQILATDVYGLGPSFSLYFAAIAGTMAVGSLLNSRLVRRLGMRRLSHAAILGFAALAAVQLLSSLAFGGRPPLALFIGNFALNMFLFAFTVANFNAMAMEPLGAVAGTASSFIGACTTLTGALCGLFVGQHFNGTVLPLATGYLVLSVLCVLVVLWTEQGRLFRPQHTAPPH